MSPPPTGFMNILMVVGIIIMNPLYQVVGWVDGIYRVPDMWYSTSFIANAAIWWGIIAFLIIRLTGNKKAPNKALQQTAVNE